MNELSQIPLNGLVFPHTHLLSIHAHFAFPSCLKLRCTSCHPCLCSSFLLLIFLQSTAVRSSAAARGWFLLSFSSTKFSSRRTSLSTSDGVFFNFVISLLLFGHGVFCLSYGFAFHGLVLMVHLFPPPSPNCAGLDFLLRRLSATVLFSLF